MTQITDRTVKVTLEGPPDLVKDVSWRINQFFTVTYVSQDDNSRLLSDNTISRFLRVIPPDQAHRSHHSLESRPGSPGPGQETIET